MRNRLHNGRVTAKCYIPAELLQHVAYRQSYCKMLHTGRVTAKCCIPAELIQALDEETKLTYCCPIYNTHICIYDFKNSIMVM
jgi:hypothetical protein